MHLVGLAADAVDGIDHDGARSSTNGSQSFDLETFEGKHAALEVDALKEPVLQLVQLL